MVTENADLAEFELPYFLKLGKNLFNIFVQTKKGQLEQEFIVTYEPLRKNVVDPPPLKGMIMIGQTNSDNMLQAYEGSTATSAAKNDLLLSAAYSFGITENSDLSLNGFIKFDRHQNRSLAAEESFLTIPSNLAEGFLIFFLGKSMELLFFLEGIFVVMQKSALLAVILISNEDGVNECS